ncbi:enoyl-CoA delta isomerase 1, mitochondrial-like [Diprion similis]|uniref:enoyl-CoA delta isomerase 1, mitochondrial-like n=1 Tax=Diprion similis TaxID=362088 RepID=UPI001EF9579E|nr:enoyl-CoA delta isomerase 1, mitochondrial-like [Diprion similis]
MTALRGQVVKMYSRLLGSSTKRQYATIPKFVDILVNENTGVATLSINRPPVNSLNLDLIRDLNNSFKELEKSQCQGVILTSTLPSVFSAGLDITELYNPDIKRFEALWDSLQDLWITLYGLSLPTAAAINGASPAGGCLLAISCDYRVFVEGKGRLGLNETSLGLIVPKWLHDTMTNIIGHRHSEISLLRGSLYSPAEALKIGLVDELASNKEDAIGKCENYIESFAKIPLSAILATKQQSRKATISWLEENRNSDLKRFVESALQPHVQKGLGAYIQSLKKK